MLFKRNQDAVEALLSHNVDILKIGGNSYLKARKLSADLQILVSQQPPKRGVIFTRTDSGLTRLEDLKNHTIALGDRYSTISTWACYHLVQAGVTPANLKDFQFLDSISNFETNSVVRLQSGRLTSHMMTIRAVLTNGFDAGVASERQFLEGGPGLVALKTFSSDPVFWVTRADFPRETATNLKQALVALKDQRLFKAFSGRITHYLPASEAELEDLRRAMEVTAEHFGGNDEK
jgi:ABC-type phosphate/phosphonate transport system substrate-binding protein